MDIDMDLPSQSSLFSLQLGGKIMLIIGRYITLSNGCQVKLFDPHQKAVHCSVGHFHLSRKKIKSLLHYNTYKVKWENMLLIQRLVTRQ